MTFSQELIGILLLFLVFALVIIKEVVYGDLYFNKENFEIRVSNKGDDYNKKMYRMWGKFH